MATVVLDVATVRAANRLLHSEPVRPDTGRALDLDIAALGTLIDALVWFDEVLVPDLGHQGSYEEFLSPLGPLLKVASISEAAREDIAVDAAAWLEEWPRIEDFARLLGVLPTYGHEYWWSSSFRYLLIAALHGLTTRTKYESEVAKWVRDSSRPSPGAVVDSWSELLSAFKPHARRRLLKGTPYVIHRGYASDGRVPPGSPPADPVEPGLHQFCRNLAWLTFRTRCYDLAARRLDAAYMPHPLRARIAGFSASSDDIESDTTDSTLPHAHPYIMHYIDVLQGVHERARESVGEIVGTALLPLACSPLLPHVVRKAKRKARILDVAYGIREAPGARKIRAHMASLEREVARGNLPAVLAFSRELAKLTKGLEESIGLREPSAPHLTVSIAGIVSAGAPATALPRGVRRRRFLLNPRLRFLRNVFEDLARASSLGALYEVLSPAGLKGDLRNRVQGETPPE